MHLVCRKSFLEKVDGVIHISAQAGQAMNAFLYSHDMRPISTTCGFIVDSSKFTLFDDTSRNYTTKPAFDVSSYFRRNRVAKFSCDSSLSVDLAAIDNIDDNDPGADETFDTSLSTLDSFGPCTPPRSRRGSIADPAFSPSVFDPLPSTYNPDAGYIFSNTVNFLDSVSLPLATSGCAVLGGHDLTSAG
jgi:hypothetical protein